tara:strand:+ start:535 stop:681 length:147 start_codon:yes stop_codon:yes gene_type:complete
MAVRNQYTFEKRQKELAKKKKKEEKRRRKMEKTDPAEDGAEPSTIPSE